MTTDPNKPTPQTPAPLAPPPGALSPATEEEPMRHLLSIITPVHPGSAAYLPLAYESLERQQCPPGWDWEWLVQEDGEGVDAAAHLPSDPRIRIAQSRHGGPHVARTVALGRSAGRFIKTLDADDLLAEGVLARDIRTLEDNPLVGWVTSAALDLLPNGELVTFDGAPPAGLLKPGSVLHHWERYRAPLVHPATLCVRRSLVVALGGWMALPASGDTGLLLSLEALAPGWFQKEAGLHYRKHAAQITADARHTQGPEWEARTRLIGERARLLQQHLQLGAPPATPSVLNAA
ncbi:glycosyltransferase family 2 protein [Streptomyces sp. NPDC050485]|uniref:glycosyltransferase family 2 protein n=1 Tax=Streptomyces sp. NPDC050485 TaxID=3365617 RepID=UPI003797159B